MYDLLLHPLTAGVDLGLHVADLKLGWFESRAPHHRPDVTCEDAPVLVIIQQQESLFQLCRRDQKCIDLFVSNNVKRFDSCLFVYVIRIFQHPT